MLLKIENIMRTLNFIKQSIGFARRGLKRSEFLEMSKATKKIGKETKIAPKDTLFSVH